MAQFEKHFVQDLTQDIKVRHYGTIVFNADNLSNIITIDLYNGTEPYSGGGSVSCSVICPDGVTVPVTNGSISGNTVTVTLTGDCFTLPGQIGVGVQVITGDIRTTVLKAIYNVELFETETTADPGSRITMSVGQLVSDIENATAQIPASDMAALMAGIAPTFSDTTNYTAGAYVYYNGTLYRFTVDHTAGSWTGADATAAVLGNDVSDLKSATSQVQNLTKYYPVFMRGYADVSNGIFSPTDGNLNRIIETEYIPVALYNEIHIKSGLAGYICYYDSSKAFASNSGAWKTGTVAVDNTKAYLRIIIKKTSEANFDTVPADAFYMLNTSTEYQSKVDFNTINSAIYGTAYSDTTNSTWAANTARWFIDKSFNAGWLKDIILTVGAGGTITVELWTRNGNTFTRSYNADFAVSAGSAVLHIDRAIVNNTWISFAISNNGNIQLDTSKTGYKLSDKSSTTFSASSLEALYAPAVTVIEYALPGSESQKVFTIGQNDNVAEVITNAMQYPNSIVYIEPYEHDCIEEWEEFYGSTYFSAMSTGRGLELQNNVHIIGRSGHKLKCYYTGSNDYVMENFSLFNNGGNGGFTLENVCIDTKKIRYCVHDERGTSTDPYKATFKRCIMSQDQTGSTWDNSRACIGGGLGVHGDVVVEDCIFSTVTSAENMDSLAYHNSAGENAQSSLVIKNCYCTGDSTLQLASYGTSTLKTKVIVANCSFGSPIEELDWTSGSPNMDIYYINNEIRSN